jgi:hypothetical protein|nr:MAG TPA: nucleoside triphosphate pyrophosphohydrolase [Herelleviridae sp.]
MSAINHPVHYNIPGRKECIDEMLEKFGVEKVRAFCELNAYKYRYRHELKNGNEDLDKAKWYDRMLLKLTGSEEKYKLAEYFGIKTQINHMIEEMAELTQAFCKQNRGKTSNIVEEMADVSLVLEQLIYLLGCGKEIQEIKKEKIERTKRIYDI